VKGEFVNVEAARASGEHIGFSFGRNWLKFLEQLDEETIALAEASLRRSFAGASLDGESFLDLGSGSGLFSLCALRLGAGSVVSVDIDPSSVACAETLRRNAPHSERWTILRGSVLDDALLEAVAPATRVYSWGVLPFTGAMWLAVERALTLVRPGGLFALALYTPPRRPGVHRALKRTYNRLPSLARPAMATAYAAGVLGYKAAFQRTNPVRYVRGYRRHARGMTFWRDVEDWLGGLPWEFATTQEVVAFVEERGFDVVQVLEQGSGGNNEYLLRNSRGDATPRTDA
jgi:2-polyprenyl-6-hydroxyphenyl methylase/3-demethylubiquinone-9 3-methyltransferase